MTDQTTKAPATEGHAAAFYATLRSLGAVKCAECDGSYMLPGHQTHCTLFGPPTVEPAKADLVTVNL
jgi:hypothetical protein